MDIGTGAQEKNIVRFLILTWTAVDSDSSAPSKNLVYQNLLGVLKYLSMRFNIYT